MIDKKRVVIKVGTKVITSKDRALDEGRMKEIVGQIADIRDAGKDVLLVTSGAIGAGLWLLGLKKRPKDLGALQAAAAIGQSYLMGVYGRYFKQRGYVVGQILLTQDDFNDRTRYLNIKHTVDALIANKVIPIINENDTVATEEIKCGDNDRLSSLVADLCQAGTLILLTDVDGLLDEEGRVIRSVRDVTSSVMRLGGKSHCDLGTGGMATKLASARSAMKAGIDCVIANGRTENVLVRIVIGNEPLGTIFESGRDSLGARKRWIAFSSKAKGAITVDDGARSALCDKDKSLLASGIVDVCGDFASGDVVDIAGRDRKEFARGISAYSSDDVAKIMGSKSSAIKALLGRKGRDEVVHKDDLVIL